MSTYSVSIDFKDLVSGHIEDEDIKAVIAWKCDWDQQPIPEMSELTQFQKIAYSTNTRLALGRVRKDFLYKQISQISEQATREQRVIETQFVNTLLSEGWQVLKYHRVFVESDYFRIKQDLNVDEENDLTFLVAPGIIPPHKSNSIFIVGDRYTTSTIRGGGMKYVKLIKWFMTLEKGSFLEVHKLNKDTLHSLNMPEDEILYIPEFKAGWSGLPVTFQKPDNILAAELKVTEAEEAVSEMYSSLEEESANFIYEVYDSVKALGHSIVKEDWRTPILVSSCLNIPEELEYFDKDQLRGWFSEHDEKLYMELEYLWVPRDIFKKG